MIKFAIAVVVLAFASPAALAQTKVQNFGGTFVSVSRTTGEASPVVLGGVAVIKPLPRKLFLRPFLGVGVVNPPTKPAFPQLLYGGQLGWKVTPRLSLVGGPGAVTRFRPVGTDTLPTWFFAASLKPTAKGKLSIVPAALVNSQVYSVGVQVAYTW